MAEPTILDFEITLQTLSYAARLIASELDRARLLDRALDTLSDFGHSLNAALLTVQDDGTSVEVAGEMSRGKLVDPDLVIATAGTPLAEVIETKQHGTYPAQANQPLPLPAAGDTGSGKECLCLPLIGNHNRVIGIVTLERPAGEELPSFDMQTLNVITTLIAVALDNARLFNLATVDGLTGLYVRRYFEIRLSEELARIRRHGGAAALLMTDIDHFKGFNDTYGHQQGDRVLRELADLVKGSVRIGLDAACRYGGEEFVVIFPATDLPGAIEVAERIRRRCEEHPFAGQETPLKVTISGGVAAVEGDDDVAAEELIKRADTKLYEAKESGRNRVCAWRDD